MTKTGGGRIINADKLVDNIRSGVKNSKAVLKPDNGYGKRYEVLLSITGENGKTANVVTAWIVDKENQETRLTSVYVTKKRKKRG